MLHKLQNFFFGKKDSAQNASDVSSQDTSLIQNVANIASNSKLQQLARSHNLNICRVTWEDTGRFKGSCWGPNISDMTLKLDKQQILLPVIRRPNFADETADVPIQYYNLKVGNNTKGFPLTQISLKDYLENKDGFIKDSNGTPVKSLFCEERDSVILTSAQYCILPLSKGTCEFNVHLFNYQSSSSDPAVLVIVASAKGSSTQAIYGGTTPLYFNDAGKAANYVAERLKDERERLGKEVEGKMDQDEQERNALLIFQIPLKVKYPANYNLFNSYPTLGSAPMKRCKSTSSSRQSMPRGMDNAVLSVGKAHSDFRGITNANIERDPQFPIRCTKEEFKEMAQNIERIYKSVEKSGSLVVENSDRKTEWLKF